MVREVPEVELGTHSFPQRYLHAFASVGEVRQHVRTQGIPSEQGRAEAIVREWEHAQPIVAALSADEAGIADQILVTDLPVDDHPLLGEYAADPLFTKTFNFQRVSRLLRSTSLWRHSDG